MGQKFAQVIELVSATIYVDVMIARQYIIVETC